MYYITLSRNSWYKHCNVTEFQRKEVRAYLKPAVYIMRAYLKPAVYYARISQTSCILCS